MMDGNFQICQMRHVGRYLVGLEKLLLLTDLEKFSINYFMEQYKLENIYSDSALL